MDVIQVEDINLQEIPIQALRSKVRAKLSSMLNHRKVISSPEGLSRDYRGLAELMKLPVESCWTPNNNDHIASLLERSRHSLADFQEFLERIDRFDVLDDNCAQFYEDALAWYEQKNRMVPSMFSPDETDLLTIDDILESEMMYDAFLLYADDDVNFAAKILKKLESEYNLKICVKDRLLGGAIFEHRAIMKLISEHCHRLIVLLSDEFVSSDKNTFFLDFAQFLSLEKNTKKRFILPVKYKECAVPMHFRIYFMLDHMRDGMIVDFWYKLYTSVIPARAGNPKKKYPSYMYETYLSSKWYQIARTYGIWEYYEHLTKFACITELPQMNNSTSAVNSQAPLDSSLDIVSNERKQSESSKSNFLSSNQEMVSTAICHKTGKSKLSKLIKRMSRKKSKKIPQAAE